MLSHRGVLNSLILHCVVAWRRNIKYYGHQLIAWRKMTETSPQNSCSGTKIISQPTYGSYHRRNSVPCSDAHKQNKNAVSIGPTSHERNLECFRGTPPSTDKTIRNTRHDSFNSLLSSRAANITHGIQFEVASATLCDYYYEHVARIASYTILLV